MKIENRTELKEYRIECQKKQSADCRVLVCGGTGCLASGSGKIYEKLKELTKDHTGVEVKIGEEIAHTKVMKSGCHGFCEMGPLVRIEPYNYLYIKVKLEDCEEIYNETILGGRPVERLLYKMDGVTYPSQEEIPFYAKQTRLVLKNCGHIDAEHIGGALAVGAYAGIEKALFEMTPEAVIQTIYDSNLRGRGGAGFRTGRKWQQVASQKEKIRYVVCNGDEGDPGAFMDRSVLEGDPHVVLEAMAIAGYAIGADQGYIYVRAEYPIAVERLQIAINQAREYGLLGKNIFDTGFNFDIKWGDNGAYDQVIGTTLMDFDNMPMIITCGGSMNGTIVSAAEEGAFWDLSEYLDDSEKFPNLSQVNKETLKGLTVGGEVIGIPRVRELGRYGFSYRQDWADKLGLGTPETIDDVYNMLYQFTYGDPDGNNVDDTYGMEMTKYTGPFDIVQTWFGCGNGWVEQDGQLVPVHQTAEYKEAIDWLKKVYDDGLMSPDWVTIDTSEWSNGCKKGQNGVYIDVMDGARRIWDYFVNNDVKSVTNPDEFASMNLLGPINGKTLATSGYNGYYLITTDGAKTEEDVINALTFLDKLNDYDMLILADYGLEGVTYNWTEDGQIETIEGETSDRPNLGLNQMVAYIPGYPEDKKPLKPTERDDALTECYEQRTRPVAVTNPALAYLSGSETYSKYGADLDNILSEARTQYICGVIDEQGLQDAWDDWANKGGNDLIAEVNEAYAADQETAEADENTEAATEEAATEEAATEEASSQAE